MELSGGEAQKIAIARGIYKDAALIILDEPTAALDPFAEYEIFTKMNDLSQDKTTIFISHRLYSCKFCDKVIVMDDGEIVQVGTHDVPGLIQLFGGEKPFLNKLDSLFTVKLEGESLADVTGLIGQYAHGNEPSHHVTYLYALAGRPERTQELVREIFDTQYKNKPDGLCGNDDCGQMSAWYMLSAMGFYPVDPVSAEYVFGAPQLPKMTLHLADGKTFTIIAENLSKEHKYVDSITLNGEPYTKKTISHEDIVKGGTLVYKMK